MAASDLNGGHPLIFQKEEEDRDFDMANAEPDAPLPLTVTSRVLYMLGDITAGPAYRFAQWLELVRKRSSKYRASGFPNRPHRSESMPVSLEEYNVDAKTTPPEQATEISLWERLGKADVLDIESSSFSWNALSSLHHTEHGSSTEQSEDEMKQALEVTVNSGGVVFFALFNQPENDESSPKEAAAVIKFSSSRMATQSERLGYEFAKWLGVQTPQGRVIHITSPEWLQIKEAAEKAKDAATAKGNEIGEMTCSELLEALELSRCLLLMKDLDKEDDVMVSESPSQAKGTEVHCLSLPSRDRIIADNTSDLNDSESQRTASRPSSSGYRESSDSCSPVLRDSWQGKFNKGNGEPLHSLRLTTKLRDFHKFAKVDAELSKELEQWNDMLKNDAIKLCQENNFTSGFFEGIYSNYVVDAYELKVRLEHILERTGLISDAANTEKPSAISDSLFIGGALAARSVNTLKLLGITHILCLCSNEIGQEDSQFLELFEYKNFSICDNDDTNISAIFHEAHDFINHVEQKGGKVLVHCFEGKSRSATLVLAYLMLRKNHTLLQAWNALKRAHRRAQPNDGFARILLDLDQKLHGKVSMEWQQRRPVMKVCPICGKSAGLSSSSLKLHLQKAHKKLSSGSVDSAMTMEIQKVLDALKISRGGSVSPTQRQSPRMTDE